MPSLMGTTLGRTELSVSLAIPAASEAASATAPSAGLGLDADELAQVFSRYGVLIVRWAERIFRDGTTADDVLHEVMRRMMSHGGTFLQLSAEGQRRAWLHRTTVRICWIDEVAAPSRAAARGAVGRAVE